MVIFENLVDCCFLSSPLFSRFFGQIVFPQRPMIYSCFSFWWIVYQLSYLWDNTLFCIVVFAQFNEVTVRYEVVVVIHSGNTVAIHGPIWVGDWPDIPIFLIKCWECYWRGKGWKPTTAFTVSQHWYFSWQMFRLRKRCFCHDMVLAEEEGICEGTS